MSVEVDLDHWTLELIELASTADVSMGRSSRRVSGIAVSAITDLITY